MHIRYNETALKYEYSDTGTNEGPWYTLPLINNISGGGGGGNVAFTDKTNTFAARQLIKAGAASVPNFYAQLEVQGTYPDGINGGRHASIILTESANAVDQKKWRLLQWQAEFSIERLNDAETAMVVSGLKIRADGLLTTVKSLYAEGNIHTTAGYIFPGQVNGAPAGALQGGWYLASHSSYGLYTNTGLYVVAGIWTPWVEASAHLRAATGLYDYARGTPIGGWLGYGTGQGTVWSDIGAVTHQAADDVYTLIGNTCIMSFNFTFNLSAASNYIYHYLPVTCARGGQTGVCFLIHSTAGGYKFVATNTVGTGNYLYFQTQAGTNFAAGVTTIRGQVAIQF